MSMEGQRPDAGTVKEEGNRRGFLRAALGTSFFGLIVSVIYPTLKFVFPSRNVRVAEQAVRVGAVDDFPNNSGHPFRFGDEAALLIRTPDGEFRAFLGACPHLACTVEYRPDLTQIWCACHDGRFDLSGRNVQGPPPRPLTTLVVQIQEGEILVSRQT